MIFESDPTKDQTKKDLPPLGGEDHITSDQVWQPEPKPEAQPEKEEADSFSEEQMGPLSEPIMHTIPSRFLSGRGGKGDKRGKKSGSSKKMIIWGAVIFVVIVGLVLGAIIFFNRVVETNDNQNVNSDTNANTNQDISIDQDQVMALIDTDSTLINKLADNNCIASTDEDVSTYIREMVEVIDQIINSYTSNDSPYSISQIRTGYPSGTFLSSFKIIGGKYKYVVPDMTDFWYVGLRFADTCNMDIEVWLDFDQPNRIYFGELHVPEDWLLSTISVNANTNTNANSNTNTNVNQNTNVNLNSNANVNLNASVTDSDDSDNDKLTDTEEEIYNTQENLPDTDNDGYTDGTEVEGGYNPRGSGKLVGSDWVEVYQNDSYNYSIVYPDAFLAQPTSQETKKEVLFTATTGEFIQLNVEENPSLLSISAWFMARHPNNDISSLETISVNGLSGVLGPNKLSAFLGSGDKVYVISYNYGNKTEINFRTTYKMMYKSFQLVSSSTNTNTNTNTSNTNTNTNTSNTNTSNTNNTNSV